MYIKEGILKQTLSAEGPQKRMGDPIWLGVGENPSRLPAGGGVGAQPQGHGGLLH